MRFPKLILAIFSVFIISLAVSCKKKSSLNLSTIKIATVDYAKSGGIRFHYRITYDMYNNVDSIGIIGGGTDTGNISFLKFTYIGSSFNITDQNNYTLQVDANTNGQILEVLNTDTLFMTYNGSEISELDYKLPSNTYPFYVIDSTTYIWNNGDIAGYSINGVIDSYYYDLSRSGQEGDALRINSFLSYGRSYITTNHLADELEFHGTWIEEYFYKFDGQGRISLLTRVTNQAPTANDTETYAYTYY